MEKQQILQWEQHPDAEKIIETYLRECSEANPYIAFLEEDLLRQTSSRLFDWIDHVVIEYSEIFENELERCGFISESATAFYRVFHHPGAQLPSVLLVDRGASEIGIAISVESVAHFLMVRGLDRTIEGDLYSGFRKCCVSTENQVSLWVCERRGSRTFEPIYTGFDKSRLYLEAKEKWQTRPRHLEDQEALMEETIALAEELAETLGEDLAASVVLEVEREYWQAKNIAGQIQKNRQDRLGMGWANHDHHTFRSSRALFHHLVRLFEILGFHCRERFYAGKEAGWGAQIMENSRCRLVLFLDVDLAPEEINIDFAHHELHELASLGTVGLWCALHGDSILKAGMHHLEAQFMFNELKEDLSKLGIRMMDPFSNFPYLRQAFTAGEIWSVDPARVQELLQKGFLSQKEADQFIQYGAIGSHLENLQRREGYKGFNQKNVSYIIKKTDPRKVKL